MVRASTGATTRQSWTVFSLGVLMLSTAPRAFGQTPDDAQGSGVPPPLLDDAPASDAPASDAPASDDPASDLPSPEPVSPDLSPPDPSPSAKAAADDAPATAESALSVGRTLTGMALTAAVPTFVTSGAIVAATALVYLSAVVYVVRAFPIPSGGPPIDPAAAPMLIYGSLPLLVLGSLGPSAVLTSLVAWLWTGDPLAGVLVGFGAATSALVVALPVGTIVGAVGVWFGFAFLVTTPLLVNSLSFMPMSGYEILFIPGLAGALAGTLAGAALGTTSVGLFFLNEFGRDSAAFE